MEPHVIPFNKELDAFVAITTGTTDASTIGTIKLMIWERIDGEKFEQGVCNVVQLIQFQLSQLLVQ